MSAPPYGYDDESVIPKERVIQYLKRMEMESFKVQKFLDKGIKFEGHLDPGLKNDIWVLRNSADELGLDFGHGAERLATSYLLFFENPTKETYKEWHQGIELFKQLLGFASRV